MDSSDPPSYLSPLLILGDSSANLVAETQRGPLFEFISNLPLLVQLAMLVLCVGLAVFATLIFTVQAALGAIGEAEESFESKPVWLATSEGTRRPLRIFERSCWLLGLFLNFSAAIIFVSLGITYSPFGTIITVYTFSLLFILVDYFFVQIICRHVGLMRPVQVLRLFGNIAFTISLPVRPLIIISNKFHHTASNENEDKDRFRELRDREMRLLPHVRGVDRVVEEEAAEMIDSVREFAEATAREIMTPRTEIEAIRFDSSPEEVMEQIRERQSSRLIVFGENLDDIKGLLLVKDVLLIRPADPMSLLRETDRVSIDMRLPELLRRLRRSGSSLAVVLDEFGGTAGIVTLHDLFERVIGDHIEDEEDVEEWFEQREDGSVALSGRAEVWEVNQELGLDLDESLARTMGGYFMHTFGHVPNEGEEIEVPGGTLRLEQIEDTRLVSILYIPRVEEVHRAPIAPGESSA